MSVGRFLRVMFSELRSWTERVMVWASRKWLQVKMEKRKDAKLWSIEVGLTKVSWFSWQQSEDHVGCEEMNICVFSSIIFCSAWRCIWKDVCWTMIFCSDWARKSIDAAQIAMLEDQISVKMLRLSTKIIEKRSICSEFIATIRNWNERAMASDTMANGEWSSHIEAERLFANLSCGDKCLK